MPEEKVPQTAEEIIGSLGITELTDHRGIYKFEKVSRYDVEYTNADGFRYGLTHAEYELLGRPEKIHVFSTVKVVGKKSKSDKSD